MLREGLGAEYRAAENIRVSVSSIPFVHFWRDEGYDESMVNYM